MTLTDNNKIDQLIVIDRESLNVIFIVMHVVHDIEHKYFRLMMLLRCEMIDMYSIDHSY